MSRAERWHLEELARVGTGPAPAVVAFVHSSSGSASGFRRLVAHLEAPARYVAFAAHEPGSADRCGVAAVAEDYWRGLRDVLDEEPSAPLTLVGWSFGGVLSVELARLAEDAGREVAGVVLLDSAVPYLVERHRDRERGAAGEIASLFGLECGLPDGAGELDDAALAQTVLGLLGAAHPVEDLSAADLLPYVRTHRWHLRALDAPWRPHPVAAEVTQIRAEDEAGWVDVPTDLGWSELLGKAVRTHGTAGTHTSLMSAGHAPSLARLLDPLVRRGTSGHDAPGGSAPGGLPLSSAQSRLWFLWQLEPEGAHYTTQFGWRVPDATGDEVCAAWRRLCARHTMLRSRYAPTGTSEPRRFVVPADQAPVALVRLGRAPGGDGARAELDALVSREFRTPFDLREGSVRAVVADDGSGAVWLVVSCHHIAVDGWCLGVIEDELRLLLRDPDGPLPHRPADYQDFVAWQRDLRTSGDFPAKLAYWVGALEGIRVVPPPPDAFEDAGPGAASLRFHLSPDVVDRLEASSGEAGVTFFAGLLTCAAVALREWAGTDAVALGVNLANRPRAEFEDVVGLFVDPVVLWLRPPGTGRLLDAVDHVWDRLTAAFEHAEVPYQDVVTASGASGHDAWSPLFWAIVNLDRLPGAGPDGDAAWAPVPTVVPPDAKFPFAVIFQQADDGVSVEFLYPRDRYRPSTVERVGRRFRQLVATAAADGFDTGIPPAESEQRPAAARFSSWFGGLHGARSDPG